MFKEQITESEIKDQSCQKKEVRSKKKNWWKSEKRIWYKRQILERKKNWWESEKK